MSCQKPLGVGEEAMADSGGGRELLEPRLGVEGSREKLVGASCPPSFYLIKINLALTCRSETFSLGNQLLLLWAVHLSSTL